MAAPKVRWRGQALYILLPLCINTGKILHGVCILSKWCSTVQKGTLAVLFVSCWTTALSRRLHRCAASRLPGICTSEVLLPDLPLLSHYDSPEFKEIRLTLGQHEPYTQHADAACLYPPDQSATGPGLDKDPMPGMNGLTRKGHEVHTVVSDLLCNGLLVC
jgi:hypothetical protein